MISLAELVLRHHRLTVLQVEQWIARGLFRPTHPDRPLTELDFSPPEVARVELLYELTEDLAFDDEALETVVALIDQLHTLRHRLTALTRAVGTQPPEIQRAIAAALLRALDE